METTSKTKLSLIVTVSLLILTLGIAIISVSMTIGELHHLQQQHTLATHKDVRAIRPWMTLTDISRFYHVPEPYLVDALHLTNTREADRLPIQILAQHNSRSVTEVTDSLQVAIITYHREHPLTPTPSPHHVGSPSTSKPLLYMTHVVSSKHYVQPYHVHIIHLHWHTTVRRARI